MGHGIAAALLMATARAALRTGALNNESLGTILSNVNHVLAKDARHGRFMTMVLLTVDPAAHAVHWASAGHDPLIAYDPHRGELIELSEADLLLGAMDGESYGDYTFTGLHRGTVLFIGTDGIWEAENPAGDMYGKARLHAFIRSHAHKSAGEMVQDLERELTIFRTGRPARDDVTYVIVKMVGTPAPREMR
jgi:sigma-B regulation protein RsbU (phosphoserine phosphatase)